MNECMQITSTETISNFAVKKFTRVITGEMCASDDTSPRENWIIPQEDAFSPGISYSYSVNDEVEAKKVFEQILSTFQFIDQQ